MKLNSHFSTFKLVLAGGTLALLAVAALSLPDASLTLAGPAYASADVPLDLCGIQSLAPAENEIPLGRSPGVERVTPREDQAAVPKPPGLPLMGSCSAGFLILGGLLAARRPNS